jgi:hypothetical protein
MSDAIQPAGAPTQPTPGPAAEPGRADAAAIREKAPAGPADDADLTIRLPPPPAPPEKVPRRFLRTVARLDWALLVVLLVAAALLGCYAAYSARLWLHLASGRLLAGGQYEFGVDPFASTTEGVYWANAGWLADLLLYLVYGLGGGPGLVLTRALVVVLTAGVLFQARRPGESWWPAAFCVGLAVLALTRRLELDPFLFSLLLLAATLYLLFHEPAAEGGPAGRRLWLLLPLFALWANLDAWFILGPVAVGLALLGEAATVLENRLLPPEQPGADAGIGARRARLLTLALVFPAGLAACLLNPHTYRVFVLPPELADLVLRTGGWLPADWLAAGHTIDTIGRLDPSFVRGAAFRQTPLTAAFWFPDWERSGADLATFNWGYLPFAVLLLLGQASFGLACANRTYRVVIWACFATMDVALFDPFPLPLVRWEYVAALPFGLVVGVSGPNRSRLLVWGFFAMLAVALVRLVPLFAVVAAPVTALNLQDFRRRALGARPRVTVPWLAWSLGGRLVTVLGLLALAVLTWPGWLHPASANPRLSHRVALDLGPDPLLREAAEYLGRVRGDGKLGAGFNYGLDLPPYCAWFAPEAKPYYDARFALFTDRAEEIGLLRRSVRGLVVPDAEGRVLNSRALLRMLKAHGLDHLELTDYAGRDRAVSWAANQLLHEPGRWAPLFGNGRAVVFGGAGLRAPGRPANYRDVAVDPAAEVFGPRQPEPGLPAERRPFLAEPEPWHDLLWGAPAPSGDVDRVAYWIGRNDDPVPGYFNAVAKYRELVYRVQLREALTTRALQYLSGWASAHTMSQAGAGLWAVPASMGAMLASLKDDPRLADAGPPAAPLLAVQAARRAVAAAPTDPAAYQALTRSVMYVWQRQEEFWAFGSRRLPFELRTTFRRLQWTAAAQEALRLDPSDADLHMQLGKMYLADLHYPDVALDHFKDAHKILLRQRPTPGREKEFARQRKNLEALVRQLEAEVKEREERLLPLTVGQGVVNKAEQALNAPYVSPPGGQTRMLGILQAFGMGARPDPQRRVLFDPFGHPWPRGLAKRALQYLQEANPKRMGPEELKRSMQLQLTLLLSLGEVRQVEQALGGNTKGVKELGAWYPQVRASLAAAVGDYATLEKALQELEESPQTRLVYEVTWTPILEDAVAPMVLRTPTVPVSQVGSFLFWRLRGGGVVPQKMAEYRFLRGLFALEHGDTAAAAGHFRVSRQLLLPGEDFPDRAILERYASLLEKHRAK